MGRRRTRCAVGSRWGREWGQSGPRGTGHCSDASSPASADEARRNWRGGGDRTTGGFAALAMTGEGSFLTGE